MRRLRTLGCVVFALAMLAGAAPAPAGAQTQVALIGVFTDTSTSATGPVGGVFSVASFSDQGQALVVTGSAQFSFCVPDVDPKNCLASFDIPVATTVTGVSGSCDAVEVALGGIQVSVAGDRFALDLQAAGPLILTGGSRPQRCAVARRAASNAPLFSLAGSLNLLV